jgi:hypothetical protein
MWRIFGGAVVGIASAMLSACGGGSQQHAQTKGPCPAGQKLIEGHFHYQACAPVATARAALVCSETGYELEVIRNEVLGNPQPRALQNELLHESVTALTRAVTAIKATGESALSELTQLARHRRALLQYLGEMRRAHAVSFRRRFHAFLARDYGCGSPHGR